VETDLGFFLQAVLKWSSKAYAVFLHNTDFFKLNI